MGWHRASYTDKTQMSFHQVRVHAAIETYNRVFQQALMHTKLSLCILWRAICTERGWHVIVLPTAAWGFPGKGEMCRPTGSCVWAAAHALHTKK